MEENINYTKMENIERKYKGNIRIVTDCPNRRDFGLIVKNLERIMKMQADFWKWKSKQRMEEKYIKYVNGEYS